jgi:hypothetical protein
MKFRLAYLLPHLVLSNGVRVSSGLPARNPALVESMNCFPSVHGKRSEMTPGRPMYEFLIDVRNFY